MSRVLGMDFADMIIIYLFGVGFDLLPYVHAIQCCVYFMKEHQNRDQSWACLHIEYITRSDPWIAITCAKRSGRPPPSEFVIRTGFVWRTISFRRLRNTTTFVSCIQRCFGQNELLADSEMIYIDTHQYLPTYTHIILIYTNTYQPTHT